MSTRDSKETGAIGWVDLTVQDAPALRDFYRRVVGWEATDVDMGDYNDYCMRAPESGATVAGVCHARGANAAIPPVWLVYINVRDLDESARECVESGGEILTPPRTMGGAGRFCVIRDPAGAAVALFEPKR